MLCRIIGLLALAALLAGCSAVKLGYNNLGEVAYWWLDGYVDFRDDQSPRVREDLARLHLWHRTQELPRLAEILRQMEELAPGDIAPEQACSFAARIRERLNATVEHAEPSIVTLATKLYPGQLRHLERKYASNNAEYRKKWIEPPPAEVAERRFQQTLERIESIYGTLAEAQRDLLRRLLEQSRFDPRRELAQRERRQRDALQTLHKLAGPPISFDEARVLLRGYLARVQESPDEQERRYAQALLEEGCRAFANLHNSTDAQQRQAAVRRLRAYQRDLHELAAQP